MTNNENKSPETEQNWDYDNPECYQCGSNTFIQRVIHDRKRMITEDGIVKIDHPTDSPFEEILFTVCNDCEEIVHQEPVGDGYNISNTIQELKRKLNNTSETENKTY